MKQLVESKIKEMLEIMEAGLSKAEFLDAFKQMVEQIKKMEQTLSEKIDLKTETAQEELDALQELYKETIERIEKDSTSSLSNIKRWALEEVGKLFAKSKINEKIQEVDAKLKEMNEYELPDASTIALQASKMAQDGLLPLIPIVDKLEEKLPEMGVPIRDALETLEDDERLEIKAIKNLEERLEELRRLFISKSAFVGGIGGGGGGRIVKSYDLSASLNGSTTTFTLPSFWRVISVHLSSVPNTLRETTDYTTNASASTITFTSEIGPTTSLSTGQSCTIVYSE